MTLKSFFKKNKFFSIFTTLFLIWIVFLAVLSVIAQRQVVFYDARYHKDVSSDFNSRIPFTRYIIEPFYGIPFILEISFEYLIGFMLIFIIFRLVYLLLVKKGLMTSKKYQLVKYIIKDFVRSSFIILGIMILTMLIIIGVGFFTIGFFFVNRYFMVIIQVGTTVSAILILIKTAYIFLVLCHPKHKFNYSTKKRYLPPEKRPLATKYWRLTRKEFVYLIGIVLILVEAHVLLLSTQFPSHVIETDLDDNEFLFDFHVHTTMSDGWLTVEERVLWYIEHGITGAAFSDHDNTRGCRTARNFVEQNGLNFTVIIAEEWTDHENNIHMNYYGLTEEIVPLESEVPGGPKALNASDMIKYVKYWGGWVIVNHYNNDENENGGIGVPYTYKQLRDWGVDGFEIINHGGVRDEEIRQFCLSNNLICIGGSDTHTNEDLNTIVKLRLANPKDKSVDNIFKTLKNNKHEVIAIDQYPRTINFPNDLDDIGFFIIERFFNYIHNLDSFQVLSWMSWSFGGYLLFFLIYRKIKKVDINSLNAKIL